MATYELIQPSFVFEAEQYDPAKGHIAVTPEGILHTATEQVKVEAGDWLITQGQQIWSRFGTDDEFKSQTRPVKASKEPPQLGEGDK
jgi:hypothetical protein